MQKNYFRIYFNYTYFNLVKYLYLNLVGYVPLLAMAPSMDLKVKTTPYPLREANQALADLRAGRFEGASVLIP